VLGVVVVMMMMMVVRVVMWVVSMDVVDATGAPRTEITTTRRRPGQLRLDFPLSHVAGNDDCVLLLMEPR
jgi:hypothetical protein